MPNTDDTDNGFFVGRINLLGKQNDWDAVWQKIGPVGQVGPAKPAPDNQFPELYGGCRPLTGRSQRIVGKALKIGMSWGAPAAGAGHVLMAILDDTSGVAGHTLSEFGFTRETVRDYFVLMGKLSDSEASPASQIPDSLLGNSAPDTPSETQLQVLSPIIAGANERAGALGHHHVGSEHFLLSLFSGVSSFINELCAIFGTSAHLVCERALELCTPSVPKVVVDRTSWSRHVQIIRLAMGALSELSDNVRSINPELSNMARDLDSVERELESASAPVGGLVPPAVVPCEGVEVGEIPLVCMRTLVCAIREVEGTGRDVACAAYPGQRIALADLASWRSRLDFQVKQLTRLAYFEGWWKIKGLS